MEEKPKEKLTQLQLTLPENIARAVRIAAAYERCSLKKYVEKHITEVILADEKLKALNLL